MAMTFSVLGSGSRGNAALVRADGAGLLIDAGLGPRELAGRLEAVNATVDAIAAVLLTHTHGDHIGDAALRLLARHGIPLHCHEGHLPALARHGGFTLLDAARLVRTYDDRPFLAPTGMRIEPIAMSHDGGPTFGFRIEAGGRRRGQTASLGFVTDTGHWTEAQADALADVDLLGVESNHDVELQRRSGRSRMLIARNLGPRGHLSNDQAADLLAAVLERSRPGKVRTAVLLHLSEQCNRPDLAIAAAKAAVRCSGRRVAVHAAEQWSAYPHVPVRAVRPRAQPARPTRFPWEAA